jgi:hypothetical protein
VDRDAGVTDTLLKAWRAAGFAVEDVLHAGPGERSFFVYKITRTRERFEADGQQEAWPEPWPEPEELEAYGWTPTAAREGEKLEADGRTPARTGR